MELRYTVTYLHKIVPEWIDPDGILLDGIGTLEEQICRYELDRVKKDDRYLMDMKRGSYKIEVVPEIPKGWCGDKKCTEKHKHHSESLGWLMCQGKPLPTYESEDVTCVYCFSKTCAGSGACVESDLEPEPNDQEEI